MKRKNNIAFIDGQNLYLGTAEENWKIDYKRFRIYLRDKYNIKDAYYYFGYLSEPQQNLYNQLQKAGFIIVFKEHMGSFKTQKKGNVDTDIVFEMMKNVIETDFDKIVLVSGDGDYKKTVDYLIQKNKFEKILFPNKKFASSLYKKMRSHFYVYLSNKDIKKKIQYK